MARYPEFTKRFAELVGNNVTQFAKKNGLSRQTVGFYRNGDRLPDVAILAQICRSCDVSADWLLGLSDVQKPSADVRAVCEYTGLSEESVNVLTQLPGEKKKLVDDLLALPFFARTLAVFAKYVRLRRLHVDEAFRRSEEYREHEGILRNHGYEIRDAKTLAERDYREKAAQYLLVALDGVADL